MRRIIGYFACLAALTMFADTSGAAHLSASGTPAGFADLARSRIVLVDVYLSGRKVAEALATADPGMLRFRAPRELLAKLPGVIVTPELSAALAGDLPTNSAQRCAQTNAGRCGILKPALVGIIYDEERFRVDLFVNPRFLRTTPAAPAGYLPGPQSSLSLTSSIAVDASGTLNGASAYNIQDQTIVAFGPARIRANASLASSLGVVADDLVAEVDRKDLRYSAGLFWAPGNDFTGERRIIGAGVGTQFDTFADEAALHSTPLVVFLAEPARVELLVDGRLVSARSYDGGNVELDTSALPQGSYPLVVRIRHPDGSIEDQQRFFVKNTQVPPAGHPVYYAYAGLLANTQPYRPISASRTLYYEMGTARRLNNALAIDLAAFGTQRKAVAQAGVWLLEGPARIRAAALLSSVGDRGGLVQLSAGGRGPLTLSLDLRRIWSADGGPLIPLPSYASAFDIAPPTGAQLATGSYTQATGSIGIQLGRGFVSLVGSYRKDRNLAADYALGPSVTYPLITRNQLQLVFDASAQRTESTTAAFAGLRLLLTSRRLSASATLGQASQTGSDSGQSATRAVGSITAGYTQQRPDGTLVDAEAGAERTIDSSNVHATGIVESRFGDLRGDLVRNLEGAQKTQYDLSFQSGLALGARAAAVGSRNVEQSALVVALDGDAPGATFNILVDGMPRGQVKTGQKLSLFLAPYRSYVVRLALATPAAVSFDSADRRVTLYPGNVRTLEWAAQSFFTIFAQAVSPGGKPISNRMVEAAKSIAETDEDGYFQIDVHRGDPISIGDPGGVACRVSLAPVTVRNDFASVGKVVCQ